MAYTERNWKDASILVCNDTEGTLDKKFSEIKEAIEKDYVVMVKKTVDGETTFLDVHTINATDKTLKCKGWKYTAESDDSYPTGEEDEDSGGEGGGGGIVNNILPFTYDESEDLYICDVSTEEVNANWKKYEWFLVKEEGEPDKLYSIAYKYEVDGRLMMLSNRSIYFNKDVPNDTVTMSVGCYDLTYVNELDERYCLTDGNENVNYSITVTDHNN